MHGSGLPRRRDACVARDIAGGRNAEGATEFALRALRIGQRLADAGDAAIAEAKAELTRVFADHEIDGRVEMPALVHVVSALA